MINREKTKLKYGYFPDDLAPTSNKLVVWACESSSCSVEHDYSYAYCLKKRQKSLTENKPQLCQKCSHAHRKGNSQKNTASKFSPVPLPPEVNLGKTMEKYGINAEDLSPWSRQAVVLNCECGAESTTKRCSLNSSKSIIETGHYKCIGCWTKARRTGTQVSQETREKMKTSQQKRRGTYDPEPLPSLTPPLVANGEFSSVRNKEGQVIPFKKK